jgi:hypothetical protein
MGEMGLAMADATLPRTWFPLRTILARGKFVIIEREAAAYNGAH